MHASNLEAEISVVKELPFKISQMEAWYFESRHWDVS